MPPSAPADVNAFRFAPPEYAKPVGKPAGTSPTPQQAPVGEGGTGDVKVDDVEKSVVKVDDVKVDEVTHAESAKTRDRDPSPSDSSDSSAGSASGSGISDGPGGGDSDS